jgi:hypothetical protein
LSLPPLFTAGLHITSTDIGADALLLKQERLSSIGNTAIATSLPSNSDLFFSSSFTGGAAGDCPSGTPCKDDEDCLASDGTGFGNCSGTPKTCQ